MMGEYLPRHLRYDAMAAPAIQLLPKVVCPHCWKSFAPEEVLWVSSHDDLRGDLRLGAHEHQRFLPSRFDDKGNALDAHGFPCHTLACPGCHLSVPQPLLETETAFVSLLGSTACGKSVFLAAMTWELRRLLPQHFALSLTDTDPAGNRLLAANQEALFMNPRAGEPVALADLIHKTEEQGHLYDTVVYGNQTVSYPRPFLFTLAPTEKHANARAARRISRVLCLYDNAGESFEPGRDTTASPATRHMAQAAFLLFLFDPLQDPRVRMWNQGARAAPKAPERANRQEDILVEAAGRVRRALGLPHNARHDRPLIVVLTKADAWGQLIKDGDWRDPWHVVDGRAGLDVGKIEQRSQQLRELLLKGCPPLVDAAEAFAKEVVYIPVSSLGRSPEPGKNGGAACIRPGSIRPAWATVPMLYGLCRWVQGVIPALRRAGEKQPPAPAVPPVEATSPGPAAAPAQPKNWWAP